MNTEHALASPSPQLPHCALSQPHLRGGTLLLVEDSRVSSESIRLMFRGAGGRLRRAETLQGARRHLSLYTPDAVLVDLGLPDGSGLDLITEIDHKRPRAPLIIAISGQPEMESAALRAGADRFLAKPFASIREFRQQLAPVFFQFRPDHDPDHAAPSDTSALRDDLYLALDLLTGQVRPRQRTYALQFIAALARSLSDPVLAEAAQTARADGPVGELVIRLRDRLRALPLI